jgi:hypothetical protein
MSLVTINVVILDGSCGEQLAEQEDYIYIPRLSLLALVSKTDLVTGGAAHDLLTSTVYNQQGYEIAETSSEEDKLHVSCHERSHEIVIALTLP